MPRLLLRIEMNKEEFYELFWDAEYIFTIEDVWRCVEEYAIEMCKEQRKICATESLNMSSSTLDNILNSSLPEELNK